MISCMELLRDAIQGNVPSGEMKIRIVDMLSIADSLNEAIDNAEILLVEDTAKLENWAAESASRDGLEAMGKMGLQRHANLLKMYGELDERLTKLLRLFQKEGKIEEPEQGFARLALLIGVFEMRYSRFVQQRDAMMVYYPLP